MLKKLKIRSKLLVSFGVVLLLTVLISVYSILQLQKANSNLKNFIDGVVAADDAVKIAGSIHLWRQKTYAIW